MEIEPKIFDIFSDFIRDLSKTFPEVKNCLYRNYEKEIVSKNRTLDTCPKLMCFLEKIKENEKFITNKDIAFFDQDSNLLEEISFKNLWEKNISNKTRDTIWKYLQTFSIIIINLNSSKALKEILESTNEKEIKKEDIPNKQVAKELKKLKKLTKDIQTDSASDDFDNMFSGILNTDIGKLAKNVADDMNIENMFKDIKEDEDPMVIMQKMMDPTTMGNIFKNISGVLDNKVKSGEINPDKLKNDAVNICENMKDNPLFGNLMGTMQNSGQKQEKQQTGDQGQVIKENKEDIPVHKELSREEKSKILKNKIEAKQKERLNN